MNNLDLTFKRYFAFFSILFSLTLLISCKKGADTSPLSPDVVGTVYVGAQDNNLYAFNAKDGALVWKYESAGDFSYSTPTLVNGILYSTNTDDNLYALDAATGELKWKFVTPTTTISSPAVANGMVYFGGDDHFIYAVDALSGALKWKYQTDQNVDSSPIVADGVVFIGSADGNLYAIDATTGNLKWKYNTGSVIVESSPVISNGVVFIGSRNGDLSAVNIATGQLKWSFNTDGISLEQNTPVINNGVIYFASWYKFDNFHTGGSLYAIKESDGSLIWKGLDDQGFTSGPVYAEGKLYINSDDGNIYAVDPATAKETWKKLIYANGAIPTVVNGKIFSGGVNSLYALDAQTGNNSWKITITNSIRTSKPLVVISK